MKSVLLLLSGGMDSVVLLYVLQSQGVRLHCVLFHYGQTHQRELDFGKRHCERLGVPFSVVCLPTLMGSSLTESGESVVVPFRNPVMLAVAVNMAHSMGFETVAIGCNHDDQQNFPDCRPTVLFGLNSVIALSQLNVHIEAPFIEKLKWEIGALGQELGVNMDETWSCYAGGTEPCGKCMACQKREAALRR